MSSDSRLNTLSGETAPDVVRRVWTMAGSLSTLLMARAAALVMALTAIIAEPAVYTVRQKTKAKYVTCQQYECPIKLLHL